MEQKMDTVRGSVGIQLLNDALRCHGRGGMMVMTNSIAALSVPEVPRIFEAIRDFSAFTPDNDPHGEHDCAIQIVDERRILWKIDYYDRSRQFGSPDPADARLTFRVLTVMLAEDY